MSTIKHKASKSGESSIDYAFYGDSGALKARHLAAGTSRVAAFRSSFGDVPTEAVRDLIVAAAEGHGRKLQLHTYTISFHPDEFDVSNPEHLERIADVGERLSKKMHSAGYVVVVHADADGGHGHAHIYVVNHDDLTGRSIQRFTSWKNGLRQLNDELMVAEGLQVLPDPMRTKPDWIQRREDFQPGGFEQVLGDKVAAALRDPRSVDREAFEGVLAEHDVKLAVTDRDGWSYKTRRTDNGKFGRKKASGLTPEFTADGAQEVFDYHAQQAALVARERDEEEREKKEQHDGHLGRSEGRTGEEGIEAEGVEASPGTEAGIDASDTAGEAAGDAPGGSGTGTGTVDGPRADDTGEGRTGAEAEPEFDDFDFDAGDEADVTGGVQPVAGEAGRGGRGGPGELGEDGRGEGGAASSGRPAPEGGDLGGTRGEAGHADAGRVAGAGAQAPKLTPEQEAERIRRMQTEESMGTGSKLLDELDALARAKSRTRNKHRQLGG